MYQFLMIAVIHFLALLLPGPDFFLIARTSIHAGWKIASGVCLGIALANGIFISIAFSGTSILHPDSMWFLTLKIAGSVYLFYLGISFIRHASASNTIRIFCNASVKDSAHQTVSWWHACGTGLLSGVFNPKNAIFYTSLAAMLPSSYTSMEWKVIYGLWMFGMVLLWDILVAILIGHQIILRRFFNILHYLEYLCGMALILFALVIAITTGLAFFSR